VIKQYIKSQDTEPTDTDFRIHDES